MLLNQVWQQIVRIHGCNTQSLHMMAAGEQRNVHPAVILISASKNSFITSLTQPRPSIQSHLLVLSKNALIKPSDFTAADLQTLHIQAGPRGLNLFTCLITEITSSPDKSYRLQQPVDQTLLYIPNNMHKHLRRKRDLCSCRSQKTCAEFEP